MTYQIEDSFWVFYLFRDISIIIEMSLNKIAIFSKYSENIAILYMYSFKLLCLSLSKGWDLG